MRSALPFIVIALACTPAAAQVTGPSGPAVAVEKAEPEGERLDRLFSELKRSANEQAAKRIADRIWQEWARSGSASIDLLMQWAQEAMEGESYDVALDLLDQVVTLEPSYAEGWNRRATLHYTMHDYAKSLVDIERTLRLEPRHFGALSGLASIMRNSGRKQLAADAYERALAVYPMMRDAQTELGKLADELAGEGI
jgi:tetratricopeptide (TPR) repeat protein